MIDLIKPNLASEPEGEITFPKRASAKLDGIRCLVQGGMALSRSLKPIRNHYIQRTVQKFPNLDGELIIGSPTDPDVYRKTNSGVMSYSGSPEFTFYVFDLINHSGTFEQRYEDLQSMQHPDFVSVLPQSEITSADRLDSHYEMLLETGFEGLILRNPNALYKQGRSTPASQDMLKLKPFKDSEAVVLGVYEAMYNGNEAFTNELGRTARSTAMAGLEGKGMIGGFYVRDLETGVEFTCAAGRSSHKERTEWWLAPPKGRILKYRHMPYGVKDKPRINRFVGWRDPIDMS